MNAPCFLEVTGVVKEEEPTRREGGATSARGEGGSVVVGEGADLMGEPADGGVDKGESEAATVGRLGVDIPIEPEERLGTEVWTGGGGTAMCNRGTAGASFLGVSDVLFASPGLVLTRGMGMVAALPFTCGVLLELGKLSLLAL